MVKRAIFLTLLLPICLSAYPISNQELTDSITLWLIKEVKMMPQGKARVSRVRELNNYGLRVETNSVLGGASLSEEQLQDLRRLISLWIRGDEKGRVSVYSDTHELSELITDRYKQRPYSQRYRITGAEETLIGEGLSGAYIALWPSHGIYYDHTTDAWRWQRARMWGIVEDIYTYRYATLVTQMLENAGAKVYWPRPRIDKDAEALTPGESGYPCWMEAACYWLKRQQIPEHVWYTSDGKSDYKDDLRCRGNWVNYLNDSIPLSLALALHSDGLSLPGDTNLVGTLSIYTPFGNNKQTTFCNGTTRKQNRDLADYVQTQLVEDIRALYTPSWPRRELKEANYAETRMPNVPSMILEILSHKNMADMRYGLNPQFQWDAARAIYKGLLRYLHAIDGTEAVVQPMPVAELMVESIGWRNESDCRFRLSWKPRPDPLDSTAIPNRYIIQIRQDDQQWSEGIEIENNYYVFVPTRGVKYDFRVVAVNAGGRSMPSDIVSAYLSTHLGDDQSHTDSPISLVVNAFQSIRGPKWFADSLYGGIVPGSYAVPDGIDYSYLGEQMDYDRKHDWVSDDECGWGMCHSTYVGIPIVGNTHDYPAMHGQAYKELDMSYVSCGVDAMPVDLSAYSLVDFILGKDSASTLPSSIHNNIHNYIRQGGRLLVSGAYVGQGTCLHVSHASRLGRLTTGEQYATTPNYTRLAAEDVTALKAYKGGHVISRYADTQLGACELWHTANDGRVMLWGLPLESMWDMNEVLKNAIITLTDTTSAIAK